MTIHLKDNINFPPLMAGGNLCFRVNSESCTTIAIKGISLCFDFAYPGRDVYKYWCSSAAVEEVILFCGEFFKLYHCSNGGFSALF